MDELRESSLLFSLESLLETERERVQREAREGHRRREEELKRVAELAERRRAADQQEREAQQRRAALEQERERLDQDRLEAMKHAAVERARIEAESQLRLVELEQSRQHDLVLSRIREAERTTSYRTLTWLSSGIALALALGSASGYFGLIAPAHARELQNLQTAVSIAEQRATQNERAVALERSKSRELGQQVSSLQSQLAQQAPAPSPAQATRPLRPHNPHAGGTVTHDGPCLDDGDPLSKCLGGRRR